MHRVVREISTVSLSGKVQVLYQQSYEQANSTFLCRFIAGVYQADFATRTGIRGRSKRDVLLAIVRLLEADFAGVSGRNGKSVLHAS